jgi:cobalt/nickel transport system permease protein
MHIPDGFLSGPVIASTLAVSLAADAVAVSKAGRALNEKQVPLLGVTSAFIFAAQMLNFPIAAGTSGHFLGATLAAVILGPWNALLVITTVLIIQCFLFADGGITALGANILNMGVVGALGGYWIFRAVKAVVPSNKAGLLMSVGIASWFSVVLASMACAIELVLSGTSPAAIVVPAMVGVHALIGIGEAIITSAVLSIVLVSRPELLSGFKMTHLKEAGA